MDGSLITGLAARVLPQDMDLQFGFEAEATPGVFVVHSFEGREALFDLFEVTIDLIAHDSEIDLQALLDTPAALGIYHKYDAPRFLHGQIAEVEKRGTGHRRSYYRVVLRPSLHRLAYISDARIFQNQSVVEISNSILQETGVVDVDWRMALDHEAREYCVQYGETSYDFLRRIWAEEGIFFWFEHGATGHRLILSDAPLAMPTLSAAETLRYNATSGGATKGFWVTRFDQIERVRATQRVARDYSFKNPSYTQEHSVGQYASNGAKGTYELYHYPGRHKSPTVGQPFNDHALEAHRVEATTATGETNSIQLSAGFIFALTDHPNMAANSQHRLLFVSHHGTQPAALEEDTPADGATHYSARFTTQPARLPYRAINPNPKPMVDGPQIAHVTGPAGEEIYCDEHGRVKIWFPWDRHGAKDEHSSCWVRVAQNWAGGTWGHMAIPRIGHEVVVDFLGGDPDQPIITGRTYHSANKPPYPLPANKTRMTIKSKTHKGSGSNELRFEDEKDQEEVFIHAQKDKNTKVENNQTERVNTNKVESIGHNKASEIGNDRFDVIGGNMHLSVGPTQKGQYTPSGADDMKEGIGGTSYGLGEKGKTPIGEGNLEITVEKDVGESIGRNNSQLVGKNKTVSVKKSFFVDVAEEYIIDVGEKLTLKCGQSLIVLTKDGSISVNGKVITQTGDELIKLLSDVVKVN